MNKYFSNVHYEISESDIKKPLIFYGAGKYAKINTKYWIQNGINPAVFADKNPEKYSETIEGTEITSLDDAMARFPDSLIVLSVAPEWVSKTTEQLLYIGIDESIIRYPEALTFRKGCFRIGSYYSVFTVFNGKKIGTRVKFCSSVGTNVLSRETLISNNAIDFLKEYTEKLINNELQDIKLKCNNCTMNNPNYYLKYPSYQYYYFQQLYKNDICNYKCPECILGIPDQLKILDQSIQQIPLLQDINQKFNILTDKEIENIKNVEILNAEPLLNPDLIPAINKMKEKFDVPIKILTNGSIKNADIKNFILTTKTTLLVDFSAGSANVYKQIKGVDLFDTVINNLHFYSNDKMKIMIKYILFSGINDNIEEFRKFVKIVSELNCMVELAINTRQTPLSIPDVDDQRYKKTDEFILELEANKIYYKLNPGYMAQQTSHNKNDLKYYYTDDIWDLCY